MWTRTWIQFWRCHGEASTLRIFFCPLINFCSFIVLLLWSNPTPGWGYGPTEPLSLDDRVARKPTAPPGWLTRPHGPQLVPAALTRCPSARPGWKAQKRGAWVPSAAQEASTRTERPIPRDILSGRWQGPLATAAWETTNPWRPRLWLRYTWEFHVGVVVCCSQHQNLNISPELKRHMRNILCRHKREMIEWLTSCSLLYLFCLISART